ncbi:hypothetical protein A1O1_08584 [Capronia coronata CBS 617.96]|uniref:Ornithine aminotransferase n=1 Tax=Capronia coronata CBS 617.96 TaxID=1182541 RepID=W9YDQ7_9EURO|nr:uncharacterized protein A1O1_08584 [Capronia coronata CBS 617.96]EXJ80439.1 hypothetical protein A1O1_08584 [Capronia coronata CBS 617.96]
MVTVVNVALDEPREVLATTQTLSLSSQSASHIQLWQEKVRGGFAALPIVFASAHGHTVTDVDGKKYIDMITQFAVLNFGHGHPKIVEAVVEQTRKLSLVNTSFINPLYAKLADRITKKFGYDSIAAMLSGSEAVDSAIKISRKWAYVKKGIPADEALILTTDRCYHGINLTVMPLSNRMAENFGKHLPNVGPFSPIDGRLIRYGSSEDLEEVLEQCGTKVAAFLVEPIQGYAGTRIPPDGYLRRVQDICQKHNVLVICDEIQTGFGRTGRDLAYQHELGVKPDLVLLGKGLTGGVTPLSLVMGKKHVMDILAPGEVANTYAASPPACAAALAVLDILEEDQISARAQRLGRIMSNAIQEAQLPHLLEHRGKGRGLFQTLVIDESADGLVTARRIAALCAVRGVLVGNGSNRVRLSPPLTISETALLKAVNVIASAFRDVGALGDFAGSEYLN